MDSGSLTLTGSNTYRAMTVNGGLRFILANASGSAAR